MAFLLVRIGIYRVGEDRGADVEHVDADLMGAASVKIAEDEAGVIFW